MAVITALEPQQHDAERVNVYLDGRFGFGATQLGVAAHRLHVGQELSEEEVEALKQDDLVERAFNAALNLLSFRPRSAGELRTYFRRKGTEPETAEAVIEKLARIGLVDDQEFARFWVESRTTFRPRGARAVRAELRQKGVDGDVIEGALADRDGEGELAYQAGLKKVKSYARLNEKEFARRMIGFLQRRGFAYGAAASATKRLAEEVRVDGEGVKLPIEEEIEE